MGDKLYFYCKHNVFENIIKNRKIWLSDMRKSNDYSEIAGNIEEINDALKEELNKSNLRFSKNEKDNRIIKKQILQHALKRNISNLMRSFWLAMCFTDLEDDLSQWRGYGNDGKGYSICFNKNKLEKQISHSLIKLREVAYSDDDHKSFIRDAVANIVSRLSELSVKGRCITSQGNLTKDVVNEIKTWADSLVDTVAFYKNSSFMAEKETRLCYSRVFLLEQLKHKDKSSYLNKLKCRVTENDIIAYIELEIELDVIEEIIIGPTNSVTVEDVRLFLSIYTDATKVLVKKSQIPYRSRK